MRLQLAPLLFVLGLPFAAIAQQGIIPADVQVEKLFEGKYLTEGVAVAPDGSAYFSEITFSHLSRDKSGAIEAGYIWKFDPATKKTSIFRSPSGMSNGLKFDAAGNLLACEGADYGGRRVTRTDMKTGKATIIAGLYEGRPFNAPNDLTIDLKGRIYFSDPRYLGHEPIEQPVVGVYRIDPDGKVTRIITDAGKANGVAISPDQKTLYVVSNDNGSTGMERLNKGAQDPPNKIVPPTRKGLMALLAYDLAADGSAKFRETLVDYGTFDGPDGLVVDTDGNLFVATRAENRPGITVYSPKGKELAYLQTEVPTNVGFGRGHDANMLYITAGTSLYRVKVNAKGYHLPAAE